MNTNAALNDASCESNPYFAAIDLGSNSFHMLIIKLVNDEIEVVDRLKDMVQIASGLKVDGTIKSDSQARALHCLSCFRERLQDIPPEQIRAVGTKALRSATNSTDFIRQAEAALGHTIDIISGYEEARLIYAGVVRDISPDKGDPFIIDIGGGSTEFIIGNNNRAILLESLSIGCVTFTDNFFNEDDSKVSKKISPKMIQNTYYATCAELDIVTRRYRKQGWDICVGSSGTMRAIAELMPSGVLNGVITREGLQQLVNQLQQYGILSNTGAISSKRLNVLPAGIIILWAIFDQLLLDEIHVVGATLKEGLLYDTIGRLTAKDMREETVKKLIHQYAIDLEQAERVDKTLTKLVDRLPNPFSNGVNIRKIIHWAALLHEVGFCIAHSGYHNHGAYLLQNGNLAGFNMFEQELLAMFVGAHRRKINSARLAVLTSDTQSLLAVYFACLRIAVLLNHRREDSIVEPTIIVEEQNITLTFPTAWLKEHPLTHQNLIDEQEYLKPINIQLHFS